MSNHLLAERYHISPLEVRKWSFTDRQCFLAIIADIEAGLKYQEELGKFKSGTVNGRGDDSGSLSPDELRALQEEAENTHGRWSG